MSIKRIILVLLIVTFLTSCSRDSQKIDFIYEDAHSGDLDEIIIKEPIVFSLPYYFDEHILHGITMENTEVYDSITYDNIIFTIDEKCNVDILQEDVECFMISYNNQTGYVKKEAVKYFIYDKVSELTIATDVSGFNYNREFRTKEDFEEYLLKYRFNYVYIRLGGRGYGKAGNMYYDDKIQIFVDACEYLGVPYGFYFLDEALNEKEIHEEYKFIKKRIDTYDGKFHLLPLALDMENQHGDGRADNEWEKRVQLVNLLIDDFSEDNTDCIVYANGARIETYLKDLKCMYWAATYTFDDRIPKEFYNDFIFNEQQKESGESVLNTEINKSDTDTLFYSKEFLDKVVAWQFTESAAKQDGIEGALDLDLMKNDFFVDYCSEIYN